MEPERYLELLESLHRLNRQIALESKLVLAVLGLQLVGFIAWSLWMVRCLRTLNLMLKELLRRVDDERT